MTQTAQHTQGPWGSDYYGDHVGYYSPARQDDYAFRVEFPDDMPEPEAKANAVLIEAAPELLAIFEAQAIDPARTRLVHDPAEHRAVRGVVTRRARRQMSWKTSIVSSSAVSRLELICMIKVKTMR